MQKAIKGSDNTEKVTILSEGRNFPPLCYDYLGRKIEDTDANGNKIFKFSSEIKTRENKQPSFEIGEAGFESGYTESYSYDVRNRLQQVNKNGVSSTYSYDINGLRNSKTVDGVTTKHVWSGEQMMLELNGDNSLKAKYYRGNELIASKLDNKGNLVRTLYSSISKYNLSSEESLL